MGRRRGRIGGRGGGGCAWRREGEEEVVVVEAGQRPREKDQTRDQQPKTKATRPETLRRQSGEMVLFLSSAHVDSGACHNVKECCCVMLTKIVEHKKRQVEVTRGEINTRQKWST